MSLGHGAKIVREGLVLHLDAANPKSYPGTGTAWNDLSGNGNNGTLTNGPTFDTNNKGSIVFDGIDDYTISQLIGSFTSFTVSIYFKPSLVASFQNPIDCNYGSYSSGNIGPRLEMTGSGKLEWIYSDKINDNASFFRQTVVNSNLTQNVWHNTSITYDGTSSTTYYNGVNTGFSRGVSGLPSGFVGLINIFNLGRGFQPGGSERYFKGNISDVKIYNRALSALEIKQNFEATRGRYGI